MAGVTALLRFLPFLIFNGRNTPKVVSYLGEVLPYAIMGMLVVYCLRSVSFGQPSGWLPALLASAATAGLHLWRKNTLVSIVGGTAVYMILIRFI
ncbi:MAG: AzlD domain-containing protein [Clostridia bacterium]|nr:AzlD domain-containing protein [Clostridia bacterium]